MKVFGERLRELRTKNHLKQTDIAQLLNVSGSTVHTWETDKHEPNLEVLFKLAKYFNVTANYLLGLTDD